MHCLLVATVLVLAAAAEGSGLEAAEQPTPDDDRLAITVCLVPEMARIEEVDPQTRPEPGQWEEEAAAARADWKQKCRAITAVLTPEVVRALSGWARAEMGNYNDVPTLGGQPLQPVSVDEDANRLVLEVTVDTLPTHSELVTRWLKLYLSYDLSAKSITRATITIRGEVLE